MNLIKKFLKTSSIYFLGKALSFVVTFAMLKVYTSNITTENYGFFDLSVSYIQAVIPFTFIEIWSGMLRRVLYYKNQHEKYTAVTTSIFILLLILPVYCIAFWFFFSVKPFQGSSLIFFYSLCYLFYSYACILSRALQRNKLFAISGIVGSLGNAVVGFVSVYIFHLQYEALFLSISANYIVQTILIFVSTKIWRFLKISQFRKSEAKNLLLFCYPLSLNTLVNYAYTGLYKSVINNHLGRVIWKRWLIN